MHIAAWKFDAVGILDQLLYLTYCVCLHWMEAWREALFALNSTYLRQNSSNNLASILIQPLSIYISIHYRSSEQNTKNYVSRAHFYALYRWQRVIFSALHVSSARQLFIRKNWGLCNIRYPSETHLKTPISWNLVLRYYIYIYINCATVSTLYMVLCAKYLNDCAITTYVTSKRGFVIFEFELPPGGDDRIRWIVLGETCNEPTRI